MEEVASRDGLPDFPVILAATRDRELVPLHDLE